MHTKARLSNFNYSHVINSEVSDSLRVTLSILFPPT